MNIIKLFFLIYFIQNPYDIIPTDAIKKITNHDKNSILNEQIAKFQLVNGDSVFVPKIVNGDTSSFIFTVPSLKANENLKLITPDNFDGNVSFC